MAILTGFFMFYRLVVLSIDNMLKVLIKRMFFKCLFFVWLKDYIPGYVTMEYAGFCAVFNSLFLFLFGMGLLLSLV